MKAAEVRTRLGDSSAAAVVDKLDTLAQEVALVFENKIGAPAAAKRMVTVAREPNPSEADRADFEKALCDFVACASDDIRDRNWWSRRQPRRDGSSDTSAAHGRLFGRRSG